MAKVFDMKSHLPSGRTFHSIIIDDIVDMPQRQPWELREIFSTIRPQAKLEGFASKYYAKYYPDLVMKQVRKDIEAKSPCNFLL